MQELLPFFSKRNCDIISFAQHFPFCSCKLFDGTPPAKNTFNNVCELIQYMGHVQLSVAGVGVIRWTEERVILFYVPPTCWPDQRIHILFPRPRFRGRGNWGEILMIKYSLSTVLLRGLCRKETAKQSPQLINSQFQFHHNKSIRMRISGGTDSSGHRRSKRNELSCSHQHLHSD